METVKRFKKGNKEIEIDLIKEAIENHINSLDSLDREDYGIRYTLILKKLNEVLE